MNLRKILAGALAFIMLVSTLAVGGVAAKGELPFTDVPEGEWYYDATRYVWENGLMNGTGNGSTFSPNGSLTRAMVVTVLYRMEGEPSTRGGGNVFCDLEEGAYYILPVDWAKDNNIVTSTGTNDNGEDQFSPNRAITRQELATMFVRYARYRYVITEDTTDISSFKDADKVASWAEEAMAWCNAVGLIKGTGNGDTLSPEDTASRAQFATIIERFREEAEFEYEYLLKRPKPLSTYTEKEYSLIHDADLYVAVDGNDSNPGTEDKPLATFEAAVKKVRELKKTAKDEIVVAFKAGDYGNLQIELTEADSGTEKVPIKYTCYGDGDVLFSNGVTAYIDEFGPIDESDYYLFPEKNRKKIVKADMSGKATIGEMNGMCQLFSEVERIDMARYPNKNPTGKFNVDKTMVFVESYVQTNEGSIGYGAWDCKLDKLGAARFDSYHTYENIAAIGKAGHEYDGDYLLINGYDKETDTLKMIAQDTVYGFGSMGGVSVYYMNISEELDQQGEFWFDPSTKTLYLYDPEFKRYTLATAGTFLNINGADHLTFEGIDFSYCSEDAIVVNADNVTIDDTRILGSNGNYTAVYLNGMNNKLINSELCELSAGGVVVTGGDFEFLTPCNSVVDNNTIHDYGQVYHTWTAGVRLTDAVGATVSHNEIYHAPHVAIMFSTIWDRSIDCVMEYNYIHDILTYTDLGAIYCGRTHTDRDNIVRYNMITNVSSGQIGAWAVYIDDGISGQQFYGNMIYQPGGYAFLHSGGRDNVIRDNVIIGNENGNGQSLRIWAKWVNMLADEGKVGSGNWAHMLTLIPQRLPKDPEALKLWEARWPEFFDAYYGPEVIPENINEYNMLANSAGCIIKNNYSFGFKELEHWDLDYHNNKFNEYKNNPIWGFEAFNGEGDAPHIFVNPAQGDYSLRDDIELEFETPYDFSKIGRY